PRVAAHGKHVYAVWHQARHGLDNVYLAVSRDYGRHFRDPVRVSDNRRGSVAEMLPTVAARSGEVVVAWQEFAVGRSDDRGRVMLARLDSRGRKKGPDLRVDDTDEGGKWLPQVALDGSVPVVAWIDERDRGLQDLPLEHVYAARGTAGGGFGANVRVDAGTPVPLAAHLDNKWSPTIAVAGGKVFVAWSDFRNYNWDVYFARSDDGGLTFGPNTRIDDFQGFERVNEHASLAIDPLGRVHAAWTDLRAREPDTNIFYARSDNGGATFSPNRQLDDSKTGFNPDRDTPTNQWHPALTSAGNRLFAAWQDNRLGNNDIFFASSPDSGATFTPAERVDDTGAGQSEQGRPSMAWSDGRCYVAWEDNRRGTGQAFVARRDCPVP
ncbi:MAG: sialidase family protein, partial [Mycobacteriales bacterium]